MRDLTPADWLMAVCFAVAVWVIVWLIAGGPRVL